MSEMQARPIDFRGGGFTIQPRWSAAIVFFAAAAGAMGGRIARRLGQRAGAAAALGDGAGA